MVSIGLIVARRRGADPPTGDVGLRSLRIRIRYPGGMSLPAVPPDVEEYFAALDEKRRAVILPVFDVVRESMPDGYELAMGWGMPTWVIPLSTYPDTYNKQPLAYAGIAAQKQYNSLYLTGLYGNPELNAAFREEWAATGRTLNMGKSCLRFKKLDDVDLGIIARAVAAVPVERFLATYERIKPRS